MATTAAADDDNNVDDDNLLLRVGKRNDGCHKTKTEEGRRLQILWLIHTTIKQIMGRGVVDGNDDEGSGHAYNDG